MLNSDSDSTTLIRAHFIVLLAVMLAGFTITILAFSHTQAKIGELGKKMSTKQIVIDTRVKRVDLFTNGKIDFVVNYTAFTPERSKDRLGMDSSKLIPGSRLCLEPSELYTDLNFHKKLLQIDEYNQNKISNWSNNRIIEVIIR